MSEKVMVSITKVQQALFEKVVSGYGAGVALAKSVFARCKTKEAMTEKKAAFLAALREDKGVKVIKGKPTANKVEIAIAYKRVDSALKDYIKARFPTTQAPVKPPEKPVVKTTPGDEQEKSYKETPLFPLENVLSSLVTVGKKDEEELRDLFEEAIKSLKKRKLL